MGRTPFKLKPAHIRDIEEYDRNKQISKPGIPFYMYIPVFVMNRIPSDLFHKNNPKLEILKDNETGYWYVSH